jgi:hypothetical protein
MKKKKKKMVKKTKQSKIYIMKKLSKNLFELTPEQEKQSIMMYGKGIKCLIAPYHNILDIPLEPNDDVYVFPERDLNVQQKKEIVSVMASSKKEEIRFVTSDVFIITDMIDGCCRILNPEGEIEEVYEKTFAANAHTILLSVLQDEYNRKKYDEKKQIYMEKINTIITAINDKRGMTREEYETTKNVIEMIGEDIISGKLGSMLRDVKIVHAKFEKNSFSGEFEFTKEESEFIKDRQWFKDNKSIKESMKISKEGIDLVEQEITLTDEIIALTKKLKKSQEDVKEQTNRKEGLVKELQMRHKIEYWLSEQKESEKVKNVFKF